MSKVESFWSHEAHNIRCVRESDYDALNAELAELKAGQGEAVAGALKELAEKFREAWPDHTGKYHFLVGAGLEIAKTAPPATGVIVPRELLVRHLNEIGEYALAENTDEQLRALLAQAKP